MNQSVQVIGKTNLAIPPGSSGTVTVWKDGKETTQGIPADNRFGGIVLDGKWVCVEGQDGNWVVTAAEC